MNGDRIKPTKEKTEGLKKGKSTKEWKTMKSLLGAMPHLLKFLKDDSSKMVIEKFKLFLNYQWIPMEWSLLV